MKKMRFTSDFIIKAIQAVELDSLFKIGFFEIMGVNVIDLSYNDNDVTSALLEIKMKKYTSFNTGYVKVNVYISNEKIVINDYMND